MRQWPTMTSPSCNGCDWSSHPLPACLPSNQWLTYDVSGCVPPCPCPVGIWSAMGVSPSYESLSLQYELLKYKPPLLPDWLPITLHPHSTAFSLMGSWPVLANTESASTRTDLHLLTPRRQQDIGQATARTACHESCLIIKEGGGSGAGLPRTR